MKVWITKRNGIWTHRDSPPENKAGWHKVRIEYRWWKVLSRVPSSKPQSIYQVMLGRIAKNRGIVVGT